MTELVRLMVEHGLVIRAIPKETTSTYEARHAKDYPDGVVFRDERTGREFVRVVRKNSQGGRFIIARKPNQDSIVSGHEWLKVPGSNKKTAFFDTIEEAIAACLRG